MPKLLGNERKPSYDYQPKLVVNTTISSFSLAANYLTNLSEKKEV